MKKRKVPEQQMSRVQHVQWAKGRAMEYYEQRQYIEAVNSMLSDLSKHPDTQTVLSLGHVLGVDALARAEATDGGSVREFISGFN